MESLPALGRLFFYTPPSPFRNLYQITLAHRTWFFSHLWDLGATFSIAMKYINVILKKLNTYTLQNYNGKYNSNVILSSCLFSKGTFPLGSSLLNLRTLFHLKYTRPLAGSDSVLFQLFVYVLFCAPLFFTRSTFFFFMSFVLKIHLTKMVLTFILHKRNKVASRLWKANQVQNILRGHFNTTERNSSQSVGGINFYTKACLKVLNAILIYFWSLSIVLIFISNITYN